MVTCQREIKKFIGEVERLGSPCSLYKDWHHSLFSDGAPGREEAAISLSVSSSCPPFSKWQQHNRVSMLNTKGLEIPLPQQGEVASQKRERWPLNLAQRRMERRP
jgi:hypothetical protein